MPKLLEYQGKQLLRDAGIPVPRGGIASTPGEALRIATSLAMPVVVKAQVGVTGRFKAGGIRFASTPSEVEQVAGELLGTDVKGSRVGRVLVEERLDIEREMYAGVIVDDSCKVRAPVLMFSTHGGVDIEEIAAQDPESVVTLVVDILDGVTPEQVRGLVSRFNIPPPLLEPLTDIIHRLYQVFRKYSARSAEINPLVVTGDGRLYPADCRIVIDQASVFRHPELEIDFPREIGREPTELEHIAWRVEEEDYRGTGFFLQLAEGFRPGEGYIGFHGLGGGGAMLGADALMRHGLKLANYAESSGNPTASKVYRVIKLVFSQPGIDAFVLMGAMLANQEQWHHAHALVRALREELANRPGFPVVILVAGNKEQESLEILRNGLRGLPAEIEIYGREHVYDVDFIADRVTTLVDRYRHA